MISSPAKVWRHFDIWLLASVAVLTIAGVAMIQSAAAGNPELIEDLNIVGRQTVYALAGFSVLFVTAAIDYRTWAALARPMYLFIVGFLALIPLAGVVGFGSARWFSLATVTVQPSELAKIIMILVMADYFSRHRHELHRLRVIVKSLVVLGVPLYLVFVQPDLSTSIVLGVIWIAMTWVSGAPLRNLWILTGLAVVATLVILPFLATYMLTGFAQGEGFLRIPGTDDSYLLEQYQIQRLVTFFIEEEDARFGNSYNVQQALISIGGGGLFGQGYGQGTQVQLRFLKVRHTDFIFSAISEEFGFIGALLVITGLMFVILRCLRAARIARDTFGTLICYGVAMLLFFQGSFNIGMNMNLLPVSGLPLPFMSYGGSSLLSSLLGIGLVESVILRHKRIEL